MAAARVTVIVLNYNGERHLRECFASLREQDFPEPVDLLLWDNASTDGSRELMAREFPEVRVLASATNLGFAVAMNQAVDAVRTPYVVMLNNDTKARPTWLRVLVEAADHGGEDVLAVGSRMLLYDDPGRVNHAGGLFTPAGGAFDEGLYAPVAAFADRPKVYETGLACAGAALYRREHFVRLGGFPADFFMYFEDADLAWRGWCSGLRVLHAADAVVLHKLGASSSMRGRPFALYWIARNRLRMTRGWPTGRRLAARTLAVGWAGLNGTWSLLRGDGTTAKALLSGSRAGLARQASSPAAPAPGVAAAAMAHMVTFPQMVAEIRRVRRDARRVAGVGAASAPRGGIAAAPRPARRRHARRGLVGGFAGAVRTHGLGGLYALARVRMRRDGPSGLVRGAGRFLRQHGRWPEREVSLAAYPGWFERQRPTPAELARQRKDSDGFRHRPRISYLTPVWRVPLRVLEQTVACVRAQSYPDWELCLVEAGSGQPELAAALRRWAGEDARIRVAFLAENRGISANSNAALALATGDFVAWLDHDDLLEPDHAFQVVRLLNADPSLDIVVTDEDKVSEDASLHLDPLFKPPYTPDLLLCSNTLMHSVYRTSLVREVGGLDPRFDGAQDWDLALRATERSRRIGHVPRVLYHWRRVASSMAASGAAKPYAYAAQEAAIATHLVRTGHRDVRVDAQYHGLVRSTWAPPATASVVAIVWGEATAQKLRPTLRSLARQGVTDVRRGVPADVVATLAGSGVARDTPDAILVLVRAGLVPQRGAIDELRRWAGRQGIGVAAGQVVAHRDAAIAMPGRLPAGDRLVAPGDGLANHVGLDGSTYWYRNWPAVTGGLAALQLRHALDLRSKVPDWATGPEAWLAALSLVATSRGLRNVALATAQARRPSRIEVAPSGERDGALHGLPWYPWATTLGVTPESWLHPALAYDGPWPALRDIVPPVSAPGGPGAAPSPRHP